jgi:hypothetical protein
MEACGRYPPYRDQLIAVPLKRQKMFTSRYDEGPNLDPTKTVAQLRQQLFKQVAGSFTAALFPL